METLQPEDLVLVAVLKDRRDLDIARLLGWYRIPVQTAPKTVEVDWLAFYQPSIFGEEQWAIRYIAPVRGHELVTRVELLREEKDHRRAHEPYFKIQLGPLQRLPNPIPSRRWKRITFLYTTGGRMTKAKDVSDLRVPSSAERDRLWRMLRDRLSS
jgi:hypothetical protein